MVYYLNTEIKHRVVGLCFCNVCPKVENNWKLQEPSVKIKVCLLIVFLKIKPLSKSKIYFRKVENLLLVLYEFHCEIHVCILQFNFFFYLIKNVRSLNASKLYDFQWVIFTNINWKYNSNAICTTFLYEWLGYLFILRAKNL